MLYSQSLLMTCHFVVLLIYIVNQNQVSSARTKDIEGIWDVHFYWFIIFRALYVIWVEWKMMDGTARLAHTFGSRLPEETGI